MVFSQSYIQTRIVLCTSLANYDVACFGSLTAEEFHAEAFAL
jgi:hypothetical protein